MNDNEYVLMPKRLTAENGAKSLLIGEFYETIELDCPDCDGGDYMELPTDRCGCNGTGIIMQKVPIQWTTIKEIYATAVGNLNKNIVDREK